VWKACEDRGLSPWRTPLCVIASQYGTGAAGESMVRGNSTLELAEPTKFVKELHGRGTMPPAARCAADGSSYTICSKLGRNFKSKAALKSWSASALCFEFVSECAEVDHETRKRGH